MNYVLDVLELTSLLLGLILVYITYTAANYTKQRYLLNLAIGFAIISLGSILEEIIDVIFGLTLRQGHLVESIFVDLGLFIIMISLRKQEDISDLDNSIFNEELGSDGSLVTETMEDEI